MIGFYQGGVDELARVAGAVRGWMYRHPRWTRVLAVVVLDLLLVVFGNTYYAFAASTDTPLSPFLPEGSLHDSSDIAVVNYTMLPIDRGDVFSWNKVLIASLVDPIWTGHIGAVAWMLWFMEWLLSFEWVEWISTPFNSLATLLQGFLGDVNWIPFALMIAGAFGGIAIMTGRKASGSMELFISAVCAVMAAGILANPVATLTATDGALEYAQGVGGEIAAAVVTDDPDATTLDSDDVLSEAVTTQLVDIFIRVPAQTITFGHTLTGDCETAFDDAMTSSPPVMTGDNTVKDAVSSCDAAAKAYVENPNFGSVFSTLVVSSGGTVIFLFAMAVALLFLVTVIFFLIAAMKAMWNVYLGILPINRYPLWKSLADVFMGLVSIILMTVFMAAYLKILIAVLEVSSGLGVVAQMGFVDIIVVILIFLLWRLRRSAKKAGRSMAAQLAKFGLNGGGPAPRDGTNALLKMSTATNIAQTVLAMKGKGSGPAAPAAKAAGMQPTATGAFQQQATAPAGGTSGPQAALGGGRAAVGAGKTANLVFTAVNIAKAAPGGPGAMAAQAAISVGSSVAQKVASKAVAGRQPQLAIEAPYRGPRQIAVGADGVGHIERVAPPTAPVDFTPPARGSSTRRNDDVRELLSGNRGA